MKLSTFDKSLIILSALLDALQFAELSYVRQGVASRPGWWHDAHAIALGLFGLIVAATFAVACGSLTFAQPGQRRNALAISTGLMLAGVTAGLIAGLQAVAGAWLVVPLVVAQIAIYVTVPVASAARQGSGAAQDTQGTALQGGEWANTATGPTNTPESQNLPALIEASVGNAMQRHAALAVFQRVATAQDAQRDALQAFGQQIDQLLTAVTTATPPAPLSNTERSRQWRAAKRSATQVLP